jgi:hypothetical protein
MPLKFVKPLLEGIKIAALFGAVALVVWSMPDDRAQHAAPAAGGQPAVGR